MSGNLLKSTCFEGRGHFERKFPTVYHLYILTIFKTLHALAQGTGTH